MATAGKKAADLSKLSDKQLMDEWTKAGKDAEALKEQLRAFSHEHQRRVTSESLAARLGTLNEGELEALKELAQNTEAAGIESEEKVQQ